MPPADDRPFRFGLGPANLGIEPADWVAFARMIEGLGFDTLVVGDHVTLPRLAPIAAISAATVATTRLRLAVHAFALDFRNLIVLAKEIATVDRLGGGRLEVGLGAGWLRADYDSCGLPFERAGVRLRRLAEAVRVWKELMETGSCQADGEPCSFRGDDLWPRPVQTPRPPLMMGGGGPRMLRLAALEADIVGITFSFGSGSFTNWDPSALDAATVASKVRLVRDAAGKRFEQLELCNGVLGVVVTDDRARACRDIAEGWKVEPGVVSGSPYFCVGQVDQIVDQLVRDRRRFGFSYVTVPGDSGSDFAPVVDALRGR
jgi:probable F420-dependent oxidoreductase